MDYFDCVFYGVFYCRLNGRSSLPDTNVLTQFMISLFPWLYFLKHLHQEYEGQETLWEHQYTEWAKILYFVWEKELFYTEVKEVFLL